MVADARFYDALGPRTIGELASITSGVLLGNPQLVVDAVASAERVGAGELFFLSENQPDRPAVGFILTDNRELAERFAQSVGAAILHPSPKAAFAKAAPHIVRARLHVGEAMRHPDADIHPEAMIGPGVVIGQGAVIGAGVSIGPNSVIGPGVVIGEGTRIGTGTQISFALIGKQCEIGSGSVIGEIGFGLAYEKGELLTLPHVGRVIIEDYVTLGANATVDRGMFDDTQLKMGCRIDNLCHIAHNCVIGEYAVMAAFAGISGSVSVGAGAQFGGRVGVADHLSIGQGARLAADSAVMRDIPAGETWAGSPAQPIQRFMRETAWLRRSAAKKNKPKE
ncbi:UDP-3-O-(3-hydroxymyristoyl)glucosamine N-acyltransferase [Woodsholea maritima]|uniref:UDP-3-O-(3-hydroxymyristoyl)glucosamine N-acyltransferase n=1 Tax=Woodsholea maritima TaxID=240237 RepID=UPI000362EF8B|nr:UDP-3-O-(3-hydroxymyristoyl)glucosamine N-acyltransferase [Woodsholea maritima]